MQMIKWNLLIADLDIFIESVNRQAFYCVALNLDSSGFYSLEATTLQEANLRCL